MALYSLRRNYIRSLITVLGIIVGIASVIAVSGLGDLTVHEPERPRGHRTRLVHDPCAHGTTIGGPTCHGPGTGPGAGA